jgi:transposase
LALLNKTGTTEFNSPFLLKALVGYLVLLNILITSNKGDLFMDYNTMLLRLGLDPNNFVNKLNEPIKTSSGYIYEVDQIVKSRVCPHCHSQNVYIKDYVTIEINCSQSQLITDTLRVKKVRLKCRDCNKTFTPKLQGIEPYHHTSNQTLQLIYQEFTYKLTFSQIAQKYGLSTARIMQIFDEKIKYVPPRPMPEVMCIDEIRFSKNIDQKFVCILYDFIKGEVVDILRNRQIPYLREYFGNLPLNERNTPKIIISDMYDAYSSIASTYFPKAIHIVDLFHVIKLLTSALNMLRVRVMNQKTEKHSANYNFMKTNWKYYLCRSPKIPDRYYTHQKTGELIHYDELVRRTIKLDQGLWTAYNSLQDLLRYERKFTYEEAINFIYRISQNLINSHVELLQAVGRSYHKWRVEIASALSYTQNNIRYTNAVAESINNQIKTITKSAYGYRNFQRFRKRVLLIQTYGKKSP